MQRSDTTHTFTTDTHAGYDEDEYVELRSEASLLTEAPGLGDSESGKWRIHRKQALLSDWLGENR